MIEMLKTDLGRFRILGFVEGVSLLLLVFVGMPLKYYFESAGLVKSVGPVHGVLFLLFVVYALYMAYRYKWKLWTTALVVVSCIIPFGTFYVDHQILSKM